MNAYVTNIQYYYQNEKVFTSIVLKFYNIIEYFKITYFWWNMNESDISRLYEEHVVIVRITSRICEGAIFHYNIHVAKKNKIFMQD